MPVIIKKFVTGIVFIAALWGINLLIAQASPISARSYSIDRVDVDINVSSDSTFLVKETQMFTYTGEYNGFRRDLTINNKANQARCEADPALQCGGFDFVQILEFKFNGRVIPSGRYKLIPMETDNLQQLRIEYEFDNAPVDLFNETYTYELSYKIFGGVGFFPDYALFYWNAHASDREVSITESTISVNYPTKVATDENSSQVLSEYPLTYQIRTSGNKVIYEIAQIPIGVNFTINQKVPLTSIAEPAKVLLQLEPESQTISVTSDSLVEPVIIESETLRRNEAGESILGGLPAGEYELKFSANLRNDLLKEITLAAGEERSLESTLELSTLGLIILIAQILANLVLCIIGLLSPLIAYFIWLRYGKDHVRMKTVIPEFAPPDAIKPHLANSLISENFSPRDLTASLIDAAYHGYIKIIEVGDKGEDYIIRKEKDWDELSTNERTLLDNLLGEKEEVNLSTQKYKLGSKLAALSQAIDQELVDKGFYTESPRRVHTKWLAIGIMLLSVGSCAGFFAFELGIYTLLPAAIIAGIAFIYTSRFMPVRTKPGVEVLHNLMGFKMYLETAEKYTLQNLKPENFERFLSYAIAFGVEKKWAETFKDIYKEQPEWFVSSNPDVFTTLILINSLNNFQRNTSQAYQSPSSSGSGSSNSFGGGGFSSGGGFSGGFSGGGGGGGGSSSW